MHLIYWLAYGLIISFVSFKIGEAHGAIKQYDECMQILDEAKRALVGAKAHQAEAKAITEAFSETHIQARAESN